MEPGSHEDDLGRVLVESYGRAYRTAYLIVRDPGEDEGAVQERSCGSGAFGTPCPRATGSSRGPRVFSSGSAAEALLGAVVLRLGWDRVRRLFL